jgi:hypothetical protein
MLLIPLIQFSETYSEQRKEKNRLLLFFSVLSCLARRNTPIYKLLLQKNKTKNTTTEERKISYPSSGLDKQDKIRKELLLSTPDMILLLPPFPFHPSKQHPSRLKALRQAMLFQ